MLGYGVQAFLKRIWVCVILIAVTSFKWNAAPDIGGFFYSSKQSMAIYTPQPVPTPFQPASKGGNPYLNQKKQVLGSYIPATAVPVGNDSGSIGFSNNVRVPIQNTQNLPTNIQGIQGPSPNYQTSTANGDLVQALINKGYDPTSAYNAANGPNAANLRNEYLGGGGGSSGGGAGGGTTSTTSPAPNFTYYQDNPSLGGTGTNPYAQLEKAAQMGDEAARQQLETMYAERESQLNQQLGYADTQQADTLSQIETALGGTRTDVESQRSKSQSEIERAISEAASTAQGTQRTNRNVLRALGILGSSYAAEALQKPMNSFDTERARLVQIGIDRTKELDNFLNQKVAEANTQKTTVVNQFNDLKDRIMGDIRFNEKEKIGALQAAQAALQQRIAEIQTANVNYQQQVDQMKQSLANQMTQVFSAKAPSANTSGITNQSIAFTNALTASNPNVATAQAVPEDVLRKRLLSGM